MKTILFQIIKQIHDRKKAANVVPNHVTLSEIRIEILSMTEDELSNLVNKGKLSTGSHENDEYFKIKGNDGKTD